MTDAQVLTKLDKGNFARETLAAALLLRGKSQKELFELARAARSRWFPSEKVEVRSVIEISNICRQNCNFCNINRLPDEKRYVLSRGQILDITEHVYRNNRRVLLLQSGENDSQNYIDFLSGCVADIKKKYADLTVILCLGSLSLAQYGQLREAGADRYILKFETSNPLLYKKIKPKDSLEKRLKCIGFLNRLDFDAGSGNIIGLPGQTIDDIAKDLLLTGRLRLTMASSAVFIPGEGSMFHDKPPGNLDITLNYMALLRVLYPRLLIPATSSLEKAAKNGQFLGLMAGANTVTIHDGTPAGIKRHFPIYSLNRVTPDERHMRRIVAKAKLRF
ncbi:MAG: radical SAM protein [bacterium]